MIRASSSGDHLLCFFAGDSDVCGGMLRFPLLPLPGRDPGPVPAVAICPRLAAVGPPKLPRGAPPTGPTRGDGTAGATANDAGGGPPRGAGAAVEDGTAVVGVW